MDERRSSIFCYTLQDERDRHSDLLKSEEHAGRSAVDHIPEDHPDGTQELHVSCEDWDGDTVRQASAGRAWEAHMGYQRGTHPNVHFPKGRENTDR
jgi:hypothetical protein